MIDLASPPRLYGIADGDALGLQPEDSSLRVDRRRGVDPVTAAVISMAEAGVRWIQLRMKSASDRDVYRVAERCARRLEGSVGCLWIDDRPDVARLVDADGVHVGQRDLPPEAVRRVVSTSTRIGFSCHDVSQVEAASADPSVDVVACGPVFTTVSKADPEPTVGLDGVRAARARTTKPLVAIGGIDLDNAAAVLDAGADTVAVLGALCRGDVARNSRRWVAALEGSR